MALANISLLNSFGEHVTRTNQIIYKLELVESNVANTLAVSNSNIANTVNALNSNVSNTITYANTAFFPKSGNETITGNVTISGAILNLL